MAFAIISNVCPTSLSGEATLSSVVRVQMRINMYGYLGLGIPCGIPRRFHGVFDEFKGSALAASNWPYKMLQSGWSVKGFRQRI